MCSNILKVGDLKALYTKFHDCMSNSSISKNLHRAKHRTQTDAAQRQG